LSVDSTPPNRIVSSSGDLTSPTRTADPSFDSTSSGRTGSSPVQPLAIPGIEMDENFELKLYCLILSDKIEIITADVEGIANFSANNESPRLTAFFFRRPHQRKTSNQKSQTKTTHRLLTADDVLAEKRELLKRKEQKQLKSLRKSKKVK